MSDENKNPDEALFAKPVKATVIFDGMRVNKHKELWFRVIVSKLEAVNIVPCDFWDEHTQLYVFVKFPDGGVKEVGAFMWNGRVQTPACEHRISLWSRMEQLKQVNPPFDFNTLEEGTTFDVVLALPEQVKRAKTSLEVKTTVKKADKRKKKDNATA